MRRAFSDSERAALFLAADGKCSLCQQPLTAGWHADHITPHVAGGPTDVVNGQALCPTCNLKKGSRMDGDPRYRWQREAINKYIADGSPTDFLVMATPGAGKTRFSLTLAAELLGAGVIQQVIVVVPTAHLRGQWEKAAAGCGLSLSSEYENRHGAIPADETGIVVTYAAVASVPDLYRHLATRRRSLVILDEIHHAGDVDRTTWGPALRRAFEVADRRLLLSGTPFRSDNSPIPFVSYDDDRACVVDYRYDYRAALTDQAVRPITFDLLDGAVQWRERPVDNDCLSRSIETNLASDASEEQLSRAMRTAIDPNGEWVDSVLRRAVDRLEQVRSVTPDAGGLVVADDQSKARAYAEHLERLTGEPVALAISDDPDASSVIDRFARGRSRWLVAVRMVSEGVDIPRLLVGVYATRTRTEMFFRQVVGRFVRTRGDEDGDCAVLYLPAIPPLRKLAEEMESVVPIVLAEQLERQKKADAGTETKTLTIVEPMGSGEASLHSSIVHGEVFTDIELRAAMDLLQQAHLPGNVTPTQIAQLLRLAGNGRVVGQMRVDVPAEVPLREQKRARKKMVNTRVNAWCKNTAMEYGKVHGRLNQHCGDTLPTASLETLDMRLRLLDEWGCP